jgi:pimeloyl-ACP methyl ester carboxylesterase
MNDALALMMPPTPGGRAVGYADYGPNDGFPVIDCHGGPGSRLAPRSGAAEAAAAGLRPIGIDRPGYGLSTPWAGRTIVDWVPDALAVADALGVERFAVVGSSTGGSYALALAATVPDRVAAVLLCCAMTDMTWPEGRRLVGPSGRSGDIWDAPDRLSALAIARSYWGDDGLKPALDAMAGTGDAPPPLTPADAALFADPNAVRAMIEGLQASFAFGVEGYTDDRIADGAGWGAIDLSRVTCPVTILHGADDLVVPPGCARHNHELIPHSTLRVVPGHGHFSIGTQALPALTELLTAA